MVSMYRFKRVALNTWKEDQTSSADRYVPPDRFTAIATFLGPLRPAQHYSSRWEGRVAKRSDQPAGIARRRILHVRVRRCLRPYPERAMRRVRSDVIYLTSDRYVGNSCTSGAGRTDSNPERDDRIANVPHVYSSRADKG